MIEEPKDVSAGKPEEKKDEVQPLVETGLNPEDTAKVAGGKIIETKDGKFVPIPENAPVFDSKEKAEGYEKGVKDCIMKKCCGHKSHHHKGICGTPKPKC